MFGIAGIVVSAVGVASSAYSADKANKQAEDAAGKADQLGQGQLAFSREQYDDWQRVYGPIQQRLSRYYSSLDANDFAAQGINELNKQFTQVTQQLDRDLARRGVDSPVADSLKAQLSLDLARDKAEIRQQAPLAVAQAQQGFLSGSVTNPAATGVMGAMQNQQNIQTQQATNQQNLSYQAGAAAGQTVTNAISSYYSNKAYTDRTAQLSQSTLPTGTE